MKLMKSYKTTTNKINFNLKFYDKMTLIDGESGVGKTMLFKAIERDCLINKTNIICLNYDDIASGNIEHTLNTAKGKVIIIDNADIALSMEQKVRVAMDKDNQYIIFTHSTEGFHPNDASIAELIVSNNNGKLVYDLLED